jgi:diguanylate cyclase (GGDEF)-like protein/PAS domain S-box-containing protein
MMQDTGFHGLLLDCLDDQIAVIDAAGRIVYVNQAWVLFGQGNGLARDHDWIGVNYLQVCSVSAADGETDAQRAYDGILAVLRGETEHFYYEYPCHSPTERRWFLMRLAPLRGAAQRHFVVSHVNITERKLIEEQVEAQSLTDPLTGLANRRRFDRYLHQEWLRSQREQTPISLILLDLDHFKAYNDAFGHLAGDDYLRHVGRLLDQHARRPADLAARYGGEEFALVLGNTDLAGARQAGEALRADIAELHTPLGHAVSASAGVFCTVPHPGESEQTLVSRADQALYQAKQAGRNRVVCHACPLSAEDRATHCAGRTCAAVV